MKQQKTGGETMPQIKANLKTMKKDAAKHVVNAAVKSQIHTAVKKAIAAANSDNKEEALRAAVSVIDSAASKGVLHKNTAARKKSRLHARVNAAIAAEKAEEAKEAAEAEREAEKEAYKEKMEEDKE
jgi:ribosomal protein S20